jgi:hypothetical protein
MRPLALGDEQRPIGHAHIGEAQAEHLTAPQPAEQHGQHHRPVAMGAQRRQQCSHLCRIEDPGQRARHAHQRHRSGTATSSSR